mgnify:CR=1 FL=1
MEEIKDFKIDLEAIKSTFKFTENKNKVRHNTGNKYKLLPYTTKDENAVVEFSGVVGAFSRNICNKQLKEEFKVDLFIEDVADQIAYYPDETGRVNFKNIVRTMFIENDNLVDFDIKTINYLSSTSSDDKIASFLYSVLFDEELKEDVSRHYDREVENILYKIVLKALPELEGKDCSLGEYKCYLPYVREQFKKDFKFIISNEDLYKDSLKRLLEYYYIFYISQLIMKLDKFEKADLSKPEALYYTLDWERTSKTRTAYQFGWEKIKNRLSYLFSHAITLEMLNNHGYNKQLNYVDLSELFIHLDTNNISYEINKVTKAYKDQFQNINWNDFKTRGQESNVNGFEEVYELFETIKYQFEKTSRSGPNVGYGKWFEKFVNKNFGKARGQLGYNLNMKEDDIILMTKICINNREKIKLNRLFEEFELRGLFFDRDSKMKIVQLYEKLNLLEKKSDSGDAQYVKSVL